jgi:hypothetical protein
LSNFRGAAALAVDVGKEPGTAGLGLGGGTVFVVTAEFFGGGEAIRAGTFGTTAVVEAFDVGCCTFCEDGMRRGGLGGSDPVDEADGVE